ncbi:MAG: hypothetical protein V7L12_04625 [Nostoc sp.]
MKRQSDLLSELCDFLYPRSPYYGQFKPEYLVFNAACDRSPCNDEFGRPPIEYF